VFLRKVLQCCIVFDFLDTSEETALVRERDKELKRDVSQQIALPICCFALDDEIVFFLCFFFFFPSSCVYRR
jgi:hypothetical protein